MSRGPLKPVIRVAPPGELNAYVVYEHQLDELARGSPAALMLNFALFFLGVATTSLGTLFSIQPEDDRSYYTFLIIFLVTAVAGVVLFGLWWSAYRSVRRMITDIKSQMPPNPETRREPDEPSGS